MSYQREIIELGCAGIAQWNLCSKESAAEIAARADARIAELEQSVTVRDTEIARLETDLELARRDAVRYRWLRRRIRLTNEQMMSGAVKKCLTVRVAYSTLERTDDPAESYLSQDRFNADCAALDAAIDAARAGGGESGA